MCFTSIVHGLNEACEIPSFIFQKGTVARHFNTGRLAYDSPMGLTTGSDGDGYQRRDVSSKFPDVNSDVWDHAEQLNRQYQHDGNTDDYKKLKHLK